MAAPSPQPPSRDFAGPGPGGEGRLGGERLLASAPASPGLPAGRGAGVAIAAPRRQGKGAGSERLQGGQQSLKSPFCAIRELWQLLGGTGDDSA